MKRKLLYATTSAALVTLFSVLGANCPQDLSSVLPGSNGGARDACYYMTQQDFDDAVALFTEIARYYPRDLWLSWNGYPCDLDLPTRTPREDCVRCAEAIFDLAGW